MAIGIKTLMVDAGPGEAVDARTKLAAALASRFGARLIGLGACAARPRLLGPFGASPAVSAIVEDEVERVQAVLRAAKERFETAVKGSGSDAEWRSFLEYPGEALARESRAADLLVVGRGGEAEAHQCASPGDVLMRAGRPILIAPPGLGSIEAKAVLMAWKETREARRAVVDALPFLMAADRVAVLAVAEDGGVHDRLQRQVEDVAAMLGRHGVSATGKVEARAGQSVADILLGVAGQFGADLVVAGGYGHARLLEWALGGVTRDLIDNAPVPCLLSH